MNETAKPQEHLQSLTATNRSARSQQRQAILVLGMHRSGTSAVGGVVSALGLTAPKTLSVPHYWNQRGYFESPRIFVAHDELLASAGSRWADWRQFNLQWYRSKAAEHHRQKLKALLIEEFGDEPLIFIKDPRMCRFVPFVSSVLADLNFTPVAILPVRNPLEVAYSLKRREQFPLSKSILLWLRHVLDAEFQSRHMRRCVLRYDELLIDWRHQIDRVADMIGVVWPDRSGGPDKIDQFLTHDLRHERSSFDEIKKHPAITPLGRETYDLLIEIADDGESKELLQRLDVVRSTFDEGCQLFGPAVAKESPAANDEMMSALYADS